MSESEEPGLWATNDSSVTQCSLPKFHTGSVTNENSPSSLCQPYRYSPSWFESPPWLACSNC